MPAAAALREAGRAERNKRDKRERLIRAARTLFSAKGFEATTTGEIAALADVGKGTLFFHASSKEQLLVMVFQEDFGRTIDRAFATVPKSGFVSQAMHVFNAMLAQNQRELELARIFARELAFVRDGRHGVDAVMASYFTKMKELVERAQRRGELAAGVDAALLGFNLFALYFSFMVIWLGGGAPSPAGQRPSLRQMIDMQLSGITNERKRAQQNRREKTR
ncbi:MAG: helix-turn-helix domain-containing protein [Candidatus Binataceae bacterium]